VLTPTRPQAPDDLDGNAALNEHCAERVPRRARGGEHQQHQEQDAGDHSAI
jgi:hypothetical protein